MDDENSSDSESGCPVGDPDCNGACHDSNHISCDGHCGCRDPGYEERSERHTAIALFSLLAILIIIFLLIKYCSV